MLGAGGATDKLTRGEMSPISTAEQDESPSPFFIFESDHLLSSQIKDALWGFEMPVWIHLQKNLASPSSPAFYLFGKGAWIVFWLGFTACGTGKKLASTCFCSEHQS